VALLIISMSCIIFISFFKVFFIYILNSFTLYTTLVMSGLFISLLAKYWYWTLTGWQFGQSFLCDQRSCVLNVSSSNVPPPPQISKHCLPGQEFRVFTSSVVLMRSYLDIYMLNWDCNVRAEGGGAHLYSDET
jgi:hypothetical protein